MPPRAPSPLARADPYEKLLFALIDLLENGSPWERVREAFLCALDVAEVRELPETTEGKTA